MQEALAHSHISDSRRALTDANSVFSINNSQSLNYTRLHLKASVGDEDLSQEDVALVNIGDGKGNCALIWAAFHGRLDMLQKLVDLGAEINNQNHAGDTPLHVAVQRGDEPFVARLLEHGADPNIPNLDGVTAAHLAAGDGRVNLLHLLAGYGTIFEQQDNEGDTPLHYAVRNEQPVAVQFLVERLRVNPAIENEDQEDAIELASSLGETDMVSFLNRSLEFRSVETSSNESSGSDRDLAFDSASSMAL